VVSKKACGAGSITSGRRKKGREGRRGSASCRRKKRRRTSLFFCVSICKHARIPPPIRAPFFSPFVFTLLFLSPLSFLSLYWKGRRQPNPPQAGCLRLPTNATHPREVMACTHPFTVLFFLPVPSAFFRQSLRKENIPGGREGKVAGGSWCM